MDTLPMTESNSEGHPFKKADTEDQTPAGSSPETNDTQAALPSEGQPQSDEASSASTPKDDQPKAEVDNFLHHPRWQERERDWKERFNQQEKRHLDEIEKLRMEFQQVTTPPKGTDTPVEVPSWFGGDDAQWREFMAWNESQIKEARQAAVKEVTQKTEAEAKAISEATEYFASEVEAIENDSTLNPTGAKIDRNKLLKTALDNDLVDSKGRWNYRAAYQIMSKGAPSSKDTTTRKAIASATTSDKNPESKKPAFMTSDDFKNPQNRPW